MTPELPRKDMICRTTKKIVSNGVVKGKPNSSELYEVVADGEMPPRGYTKLSAKLSDCEIAQVRKWIQRGAPND